MKFGDAMLKIYLRMAQKRLQDINEAEAKKEGNLRETDSS
jgi:hypothetical protein